MDLLNNEYNLIYNILQQINCKIYKVNNNLFIIDHILNNTIYLIYVKLNNININEIYYILLDIDNLKNTFYNYKIIILTKNKITNNNKFINNIYNSDINIIIKYLISYLYKNNIYLCDKDNDIIMI